MSEWRKVRLGDIAEFSNGVNFDKTAYAPGVKLIGVSDFGNRYYPNYDELKEVQSEVVKDNNYLRDGDIVFVRSNGNKELVGRCMLICNPPMPVTYSGFCIRCRFYNPAEYAPAFFAYLFKTASFRQAMSGNAVGANIQNLSQGQLNSYIADVPDYPTQERIADILSAYDNLIENNQKQIRLLEEAARRLYKEWFVDFRFPGYESVQITDGVPQGWCKKSVGTILKQILRTKQIKTSDYLPFGNIPVIDQSREFISGYTNDVEALVDYNTPVIVFGDHTRILKYIQFPFAKGADGTQLLVSSEEVMPQPLLYCSLVHIDLSNYHYARHFKYLKAEEILIPDKQISIMFTKTVEPLFLRIQCARDIIIRAQEARDRLLSKLMSGKLEV